MNRALRLGVGAALVVAASAPLTAPAQAWACLDPVTKAVCFVVGTSCRAIDEYTSHGAACQLG